MEVLARKECNPRSSFRSFKSVSRTGDLPVSFLEEELSINDLLSASSPALNILFATQESVQECEVFLSRYKQVQGKFIRNLPVQALLYQHSPTESTLVILMSHLVGDAITTNGFLNSLAARFHAMSRQELTDPGCFWADLRHTYTYIDWTAWSTTQEHLSAEALVFWKTYLDHPPLQTGLNQSRRPRSYTGGFESWTLPRDLSKSLLHACTDLFVSPHQLMLTAVALATQALRPSQDIVMMAPYSLRTEPLTEDFAGCLLDRVPFRVKWDRSQSLLELLRAVQQPSQAAIAHAVPYSSLCKGLHLSPTLTEPLAEIMSPDEPITVVFEHGEALFSAFQLVLQIIGDNQTAHEMVETVCREVRTPEKRLNGLLEDQVSESCSEGSNNEFHEEIVRKAFATCLGVTVEDVGSHTSFFDELGGSSADAVRLVWLLKEKGVIGVDVRQVLLAKTPAALGRMVRSIK
ncbi:CoA-dependent acyltransferase [Aspergillus niger CBS 101883]|uniref:CoA-dependent acyltransferase n=1 Tax=Aspergillus lacticoffeatus (strain CBS 101883) TaxID=1450533 RepID=UPI000D7FB0BD|nr:CoA-dependent acyltransferase [Aspergillus niger CBS 101883]PYH54683.1 CoA-dependent acyltransferase [Aspergillus niger CBS 101883]